MHVCKIYYTFGLKQTFAGTYATFNKNIYTIILHISYS